MVAPGGGVGRYARLAVPLARHHVFVKRGLFMCELPGRYRGRALKFAGKRRTASRTGSSPPVSWRAARFD
eukprot:2240731-Prymnesium_polylepis.1